MLKFINIPLILVPDCLSARRIFALLVMIVQPIRLTVWMSAYAFAASAQAQTAPTATQPLNVCDSTNKEARFSPVCFVRIFEDDGSGLRRLLYAPENKHLQSLLLKTDAESKLVIDVSQALDGEGDAGLTNVFIRAMTGTGNTAKKIPVIGYSEIGEKESEKISQTAFDFQTFNNIAAKLVNLYFVSRDLIETTYGKDAEKCRELLKHGGEGKGHRELRANCDLDGDTAKKSAQLKAFEGRFLLLSPEIASLSAFFSSAANRTVTAELANKVFEIDVEALEGIARQLIEKRALLTSANLKDPDQVREDILVRTRQVYSSLASVIAFVSKVAKEFSDGTKDATLQKACGEALTSARASLSTNAFEFARACYTEHQLPHYIRQLKRYVTPGLIDMNQEVKAGETILLTIETKGKNPEQPGLKAEWRIKVSEFGWKARVDGSLLFLRRIGVDERSPAGAPRPIRFAPFPGFTLNATYFGRHRRAAVTDRRTATPDAKDRDSADYYGRLDLDRSGGAVIGRILQPSVGTNVTFMSFGSRDFNPVTNQFSTLNATTFELGAGPIVGLFGNRMSLTFGWNLMQPTKRMYWGLGFGFVSLVKDLGGFLKKN